MVLSFFFYNFANEKEKSCLTSKLVYNAEVETIAKSSPILR